ncbi:MAG: hypothetical protein MUF37_00185 [Methanoregulaceae archaeon]|jgi:hypothetical protein|nr:hypothetical protein [Methanoregulaceae archaeon]
MLSRTAAFNRTEEITEMRVGITYFMNAFRKLHSCREEFQFIMGIIRKGGPDVSGIQELLIWPEVTATIHKVADS